MKKNQILNCIILYLLFGGQVSIANIPSAESLFRNGSNPEPTGNVVVVDLELSRLKQDLNELKKIEDIHDNEIQKNIEIAQTDLKRYLRLYFISREGEDKFNLIQVQSDKSLETMSGGIDVNSKRRIDDYASYSGKDSIERDLFYAVLQTTVLNSSKCFATLLKRLDSKFKRNNEVANLEEAKLLQKYKQYLQAIKKDPAIEKYTANPIKPSVEEDRIRINKILNSPAYLENPTVKLIKDGDNVLINLELDNFNFRFINETHEFLDFTYSSGQKILKMKFQPYELKDETHKLPKGIIYQVAQNGIFYIKFTGLKHITGGSSYFENKSDELRANAKKKLDSIKFLF